MGNAIRLCLVLLVAVLLSATCALSWAESSPSLSSAQPLSQSSPDWQIAAGGRMSFDTASVQQNTTAPPRAQFFNFPIGPGDVYMPNGGTFRARNLPLVDYIFFAYKITPNQEEFLLSQLPAWAMENRFDIDAKSGGDPTKDQMRLMMQSLLADRFKLAVHFETRQVPVFALLVDKPGQLGPLLQRHPEDTPCPTVSFVPSPPPTAPPQALDNRFPSLVPMDLIASSLAGSETGTGRPVVGSNQPHRQIRFRHRIRAPGRCVRPDQLPARFQWAILRYGA